ncbi:hypothetical protein H0H87_006828 [Tephrocybe sp. NHM501043]|nr:hypothetical protein H0H87_006828 [Tephrocybe sp. NHM501043]
MDIIPLPERKKPGFIKASKEQVEILLAGFAVSDVSSKEHIATLSAATNLPTKWIFSWFVRQRRKVAMATGYIKPRRKAMTPPMSVEVITAFKTEHSDSTLSETISTAPSQELDRKVKKIHTERYIRKPRNRRKYPTPLPPSPLKAPFVSQPLSVRCNSRPLSQSSIQAQAQEADAHSPASSFILREMVPLMYQPHASNANLNAATDSAFAETLYPELLVTRPHSTAPLGSSTDVVSPKASTSSLAQVYSWQDPVLPENAQDNNNREAALRKTRIIKNTRGMKTHTSSLFSQQNSISNPNHAVRPLLPYNPPNLNFMESSHPYQHTQASSNPHPHGTFDWSAKENQPMYYHPTYIPQAPIKLRSSGPRVLPPLFATTDLSGSGARRQTSFVKHDPATQNSSLPILNTRPQSTSFVQAPSQTSRPQLTSQPQPQHPTQQQLDNSSLLLDLTTTPLKHCDVLAPFSGEALSTEDIINLLLDERLVVEDPFQAAMGLVYTSRLGLNWDFT